MSRQLFEGTYARRLLHQRMDATYLVGGTQEQWFLDNATTWADALSKTGADVVIEKRNGGHGGAFWYDELPLMVSWAFRR